jgi:hypothetical protein
MARVFGGKHEPNPNAEEVACGRLPDCGGDLCSQPTVSRWENTPDLKTVIRLTCALVDAWCASYNREPEAVTLTSTILWTWSTAPSNCRCSTFRAVWDSPYRHLPSANPKRSPWQLGPSNLTNWKTRRCGLK